jgi:hypothetical protein
MSNFQTRKLKELEENLYSIGNKGLVDIPSAIGYFSTALKEQREEIYKEIGKLYKKYEGEITVEYYNKALDNVSGLLDNNE